MAWASLRVRQKMPTATQAMPTSGEAARVFAVAIMRARARPPRRPSPMPPGTPRRPAG
ncbi:Uncharacterised protein [Bordetella pertussis]|nr:Uncharacterised protein [Bordetella pertussis]